MAIYTEVWATELARKLFPNDSYINEAINDDVWVNNNKVHLPQEGVLPELAKSTDTLPLAITPREDEDLEYQMSWIRTKPTFLEDIDEVETNYGKRDSIINSHAKQINKRATQIITHSWTPAKATNILRTTGDAVDAMVAGATGQRKALTLEDFFKAKALFDDMDIPIKDRSVLLPAKMYNELVLKNWKEFVSMDKGGEARLQGKSLLSLFDFKIHTRGSKHILSFDNAATPKVRAVDANASQNANAYALFWHKDFVRRAKGTPNVLFDAGSNGNGKPEFHGSLFSANVRAGGSKAYKDETGVVAIVESAVTP